jgi:hypothetical protein
MLSFERETALRHSFWWSAERPAHSSNEAILRLGAHECK